MSNTSVIYGATIAHAPQSVKSSTFIERAFGGVVDGRQSVRRPVRARQPRKPVLCNERTTTAAHQHAVS
jgi:hypothetical protein